MPKKKVTTFVEPRLMERLRLASERDGLSIYLIAADCIALGLEAYEQQRLERRDDVATGPEARTNRGVPWETKLRTRAPWEPEPKIRRDTGRRSGHVNI